MARGHPEANSAPAARCWDQEAPKEAEDNRFLPGEETPGGQGESPLQVQLIFLMERFGITAGGGALWGKDLHVAKRGVRTGFTFPGKEFGDPGDHGVETRAGLLCAANWISSSPVEVGTLSLTAQEGLKCTGKHICAFL